MLQKQFRLPHSVRLSQPLFHNTEYFSLRYSKNNLSISRFGFVVSKKIDKRSVVRNRIKRIVRSCVEKQWVEKVKGYDMLFILKRSCVGASFEAICETVSDIMTKLV